MSDGLRGVGATVMNLDEARAKFRETLHECGFDPDEPEPDTHEYRQFRDMPLYGRHYDEINTVTGERRCIPAETVVITTDE